MENRSGKRRTVEQGLNHRNVSVITLRGGEVSQGVGKNDGTSATDSSARPRNKTRALWSSSHRRLTRLRA